MLRTRPAILLAASLGLASVFACSRADSATPAPGPAPMAAHGQAPVGSRPRLVFFMNPNGAPCQLQDQVLRGMGPALTGAADVVYYRTTEAADLGWFQHYGIRSLPLLLVTDPAGRELRRATPGIQSAEQVRQLLTF
jgi:thioredoxin